MDSRFLANSCTFGGRFTFTTTVLAALPRVFTGISTCCAIADIFLDYPALTFVLVLDVLIDKRGIDHSLVGVHIFQFCQTEVIKDHHVKVSLIDVSDSIRHER